MAAPAGGRGSGGDEVGEVSGTLRAEIERAMRKNPVVFAHRKDFGDAGAVFLAEKLRGNTIVESLFLSSCKIGAVGARALAKVLVEDNTTLKHLDLCVNSLGDDGAEAMALMLSKNTTLEEMDLSVCSVGGRGARALGEALKENNTLKILFINSNQIGEDGANALAEALRWNESLKVLSLQNCKLTDAVASSLLAALRERNSTLTYLDLFGNYGIEDIELNDSIQKLIEENGAALVMAERRACCLLFCCLQLAPTAHEHVVPSIGAVPVPVMQFAVEHTWKLHVANRFEHGNLAAGQSSAGVRARSSSFSDSSDDRESATPRRR